MTTRLIDRHLRHGRIVVLRDDPWSCICRDLFGVLVIETRHRDPVPLRLATLADKRRAVLFDAAMLPKRKSFDYPQKYP